MKKSTISVTLSILLLACGVTNSAENDNRYLITETGVAPFFVGNEIPNQADSYVINKEIVTKDSEEGPYEIPVAFVYEDGDEVFEIESAYDYDAEKYINTIGEITVFSDKYKTAEDIGISSTIEDFMAAYPDYTVWYTYISGMYVLDTEQLPNVQFLLDGDDYLMGEIEFDSEITILKASDFKKDAKIISVRIF